MNKPQEQPMRIAMEEAEAAAQRDEVPVGAVLVRAGQIIARDGNRTRALPDATAHAEMLVLRAGMQSLQCERLDDCDLHVSLEPCAMCAAAISFARIRRLYFAAFDVKGGAVENGPRWFQQATCHHAPEVYGGIRETEAQALLKKFFHTRR